MPTEPSTPEAEVQRLQRRLERERTARLEAESLTEQGLRTLYERQRDLELLQNVAVAANSATSINGVFENALEQICTYTAWPAGHVYLVAEDDSGLVEPTGLWRLQSFGQFETLRRATEGCTLRTGEGLPGRVIASGNPVWITDVERDPNYPRARQGVNLGVRSTFAFPVFASSTPVAVLEFFSTEPSEPNTRWLELFASVGVQLGLVIARQRAVAALELERSQLAEHVAQRTAQLESANQELSKAARLKDEFLAAMSHELRTPMNAVIGFAELLQDGTFGPLNEDQARGTQSILESGRHLLSLINDILDLAKIEAGKQELDKDTLRVADACESSLVFVKQMATQKRITLETKFDPAVQSIKADSRRFKQILVNLLSNAVKFTPNGGRVGVEVRAVADAGMAEFIVWDTGPGISPENQERLFKPFVQLDSKLARAHNGTGLGLALVGRLAALHGGGVRLESEVGKGSRFIVTLPWHDGSTTITRKSATVVAGTELGGGRPKVGARILYAEDTPVNRRLLSAFLISRGFDVVLAESGSQAIALAHENPPDVILMDVQMPGMDGLEATRHIKADPRTASIPVIALTAMAMEGDRELCLTSGVDAYLSKPVDFAALHELLLKLLESRARAASQLLQP